MEWPSMLLFANVLILWLCTAKGEVKPCDFPQIKNGYLQQEERYRPYFPVPIGKWFYYICNTGFTTASERYWDRITCTIEGWEPTVPCRKQCSYQYVENGQYVNWKGNYLQDQSVRVRCYSGYSLPNGQDTVTCTEDGWSPQPKCLRIKTCSKADIEIENGFLSEYDFTYTLNRKTQYICKPGYVTSNGETSGTITCLQNGWSEQPSCIKPCDVPILENAATKNNRTWFKLNDKLDYECNIGYENNYQQTKGSITCNYDGWSDIPSCYNLTAKCGPPPPIDNGDITSFPLKVYPPLSSVEYQCQSFYQLQGNKNVTCRNGEWSEPPKCLQKEPCPPPPQIPNAQVIETTVKYWDGEKVSVLCQDNYIAQDTEEMVCRDGRWQSLPRCIVKIPCSQPPDIDHGSVKLPSSLEETRETVESRDYEHGTTLNYVCDDGFRMAEDHGVTCHMGKWSSPPRCVGLPCGPPPSVRYGIVSHELDSYQHGEEVTYSCSEGFGIDGPAFIKCTGGKWSQPPVCKRTNCNRAPTFENAILIGKEKRSYMSGEQVTFKCAPSYYMNGSDTVTCVNRKWIGDLVCKDNSCVNPPQVENATIVTRPMDKYPPNERVRYECKKPLEPFGEVEVMCQNGIWTEPPKCKDSTGKCGPPPPIDNGDITSFPLTVYPPLSSVEYQCQSFYQLQGNKKITCRNGEWSEPPKCLHACVISEEIMERHNITLRWTEHRKLYSKSGEIVEFKCKSGYKLSDTSPPFRTVCINGHINYPICSKRRGWFSY